MYYVESLILQPFILCNKVRISFGIIKFDNTYIKYVYYLCRTENTLPHSSISYFRILKILAISIMEYKIWQLFCVSSLFLNDFTIGEISLLLILIDTQNSCPRKLQMFIILGNFWQLVFVKYSQYLIRAEFCQTIYY